MSTKPCLFLGLFVITAMLGLGCPNEEREPEISPVPEGPSLTPSGKDPDWSEEPAWREPTGTLEDGVESKRVSPAILDELSENQTVRVIVRLGLSSEFQSEGKLEPDDLERQRTEIAAAQLDLIGQLVERVDQPRISQFKRYSTVPYVALRADKETLLALVGMRSVFRILYDHRRQTFLDQSVPLIGGDRVHRAWQAYFGQIPPIDTRQSIAVVDTGVDGSHDFMTGLLGSKVVAQACFVSEAPGCPGGGDAETGPGSGVPCGFDGCYHGTHVAGIAAGSRVQYRGVSPLSNVIAVRVFHRVEGEAWVDPPECGEEGEGETQDIEIAMALDSDIMLGLEYVYSLRNSFAIASVNLSLGGGAFTSQVDCLDNCFSYADIVANLVGAGIAVVASAGNGGSRCNAESGTEEFVPGIAAPACLPGVISVGSTTTGDTINDFSQSGSLLDILAPGDNIDSAVPGGTYDRLSGTSMAAPHVAGAVSMLKALQDWRSPSDLGNRMRNTGVPISDSRSSPPRVIPRLQLDAAIESQLGTPLAPTRLSTQAVSGTGIRVTWMDNSVSEDSFRATADPLGPSPLTPPRSAYTGADVTEVLIPGLTPNVEYDLYAQACWTNGRCSVRSRPALMSRTSNTLPSVPTNFRAGQVGPNSIEVLWDSQSRNVVDEFRIRSDANSARQWRSRGNIAASVRSSVFVNLLHDSAYNFIIQACNTDGCSADSPLLHVPTASTALPPAAPANLRLCITPTGPPTPGMPVENLCYIDAVTILWDDVADNEDAYDVEWSMQQNPFGPVSGVWHSVSVPANYESHLFGSPNPGLYQFRVRACNFVGCSGYSNTLNKLVQ